MVQDLILCLNFRLCQKRSGQCWVNHSKDNFDNPSREVSSCVEIDSSEFKFFLHSTEIEEICSKTFIENRYYEKGKGFIFLLPRKHPHFCQSKVETLWTGHYFQMTIKWRDFILKHCLVSFTHDVIHDLWVWRGVGWGGGRLRRKQILPLIEINGTTL